MKMLLKMLLKMLWKMVMMMLMMLSLCRSIPISDTTFDDSSEAENYLSQYGYYRNQEPRAQNLVMADSGSNYKQMDTGYHKNTDMREAILKMQKFFSLPQTGLLDKATVELMRSPRCGVMDIQNEQTPGAMKSSSSGRRYKRYAFSRRFDRSPLKWNLSEMTWGLKNPSSQLSKPVQKQIIKKALQIWAEVVPITFTEENRSAVVPDIVIKFAIGRHGPENDPVFDGADNNGSNALAHAWGPQSDPKGLGGDVHFDDQDYWSNDTLLAVAIHELGHSMGLSHSKDPTAVMSPYYQNRFELSEDDRQGIEAMYGSALRPATASPPATSSTEVGRTDPGYRTLQPTWKPISSALDNKLAMCDLEAIFVDTTENSSRYFAISGDMVHQLSTNGQLLKSDKLSSVFPGAPSRADVAFSFDGFVYFIKDFKLWVYYKNRLQSRDPLQDSEALPETPKFSALYTGSKRHRLLLFGRSKWWTFSENGSPNSVDMDDFAGPFQNDNVFGAQWIDGFVYIINLYSYIRIDQANRKIIDEIPIPGFPDWLRELCTNIKRKDKTDVTNISTTLDQSLESTDLPIFMVITIVLGVVATGFTISTIVACHKYYSSTRSIKLKVSNYDQLDVRRMDQVTYQRAQGVGLPGAQPSGKQSIPRDYLDVVHHLYETAKESATEASPYAEIGEMNPGESPKSSP